jgi:hypothetical protein
MRVWVSRRGRRSTVAGRRGAGGRAIPGPSSPRRWVIGVRLAIMGSVVGLWGVAVGRDVGAVRTSRGRSAAVVGRLAEGIRGLGRISTTGAVERSTGGRMGGSRAGSRRAAAP